MYIIKDLIASLGTIRIGLLQAPAASYPSELEVKRDVLPTVSFRTSGTVYNWDSHCPSSCYLERYHCTVYHWVSSHMFASGDDEVFDAGASPELRPRSPELRRSARTSGHTGASTGSAPYSRPKAKKKMPSVNRSPQPKATSGAPGLPPGQGNPFSTLSGQAGVAMAPVAPVDFMHQIRNMMGGMLEGMEGRLTKGMNDLRTTVMDQLDTALMLIGGLDERLSLIHI